MHNVFNVPIQGTDGTPAREFRVSAIRRYQVSDWQAYGGGTVRVLADNLTLQQANHLATELGRAAPGSLVNIMDEPVEGSYVVLTAPAATSLALQINAEGRLPAEAALGALPYAVAAAIKQAAIVAGSDEVLRLFDEAKVAVDVGDPPGVEERAVSMSVDDAMQIRRNLLCFNMSTARIDGALARAWTARRAAEDADDTVGDEAAMADADAGRTISHEAVMAWVASWGTENELPRPKVGD